MKKYTLLSPAIAYKLACRNRRNPSIKYHFFYKLHFEPLRCLTSSLRKPLQFTPIEHWCLCIVFLLYHISQILVKQLKFYIAKSICDFYRRYYRLSSNYACECIHFDLHLSINQFIYININLLLR